GIFFFRNRHALGVSVMHHYTTFSTSLTQFLLSRYFAFCALFVFLFLVIATYNRDYVDSMPPDRDLSKEIEEYAEVCGSLTSDLEGTGPERFWIYFVTPTYVRPQQIPELIRLSHTLKLAKNVHWIVAEDSTSCSPQTAEVLRRSGMPYTHLISPMPAYFERFLRKPKGVSGRRAALQWLRHHLKDLDSQRAGILYFGDDDNTFDLKLFSELRKTMSVSMFPVGLVGDYGISSPVVKDGRVVDFLDSWADSRKFLVDMAGFAVATDFLMSRPSAIMPYLPGHEEDRFLQSLDIELEDILPLADNCTQVYVWHTKTLERDRGVIQHPKGWRTLDTNLGSLYEVARYLGLSDVNASR
ncbi:unnamed protein product, partial [Notodromas monacha]